MSTLNRCLGRLQHVPARVAAAPQLARYLGSTAPAARSIDWSRDIAPRTWGMCGNDILSDCTAAAVAHAIDTWGSYVPPLSFLPDTAITSLYSATSGYVPGRPETDQGALCLNVLNYWRAHEVGGPRLMAYCSIDPTNLGQVRAAVEIFGGVYAGITLRQQDMDGSGPWVPSASPVIGGHCVWVVAVDDGGLTCITWGARQRMTWAFWAGAADEAYGLLSPVWTRGGRTPEGFPVAALVADCGVVSA